MSICIYCESEEPTSSEHILQNALGADWERIGILCPTCNSLFGNTIDRILADDFVFFRNYLAIKGKKGEVPDLIGTLPDGTSFTRKGETADLLKKIPPDVQQIANEASHKIFSVHAQVLQTEGVRKGIEKGAVRDGFPNMFTEVRDYEATNPGIQSYTISINVATVVALCKSIINYTHICIGKKYNDIRYDCASRVHDFSYILKEFPNEAVKLQEVCL
ncbi:MULTISPECIES: HNH endonuclease [Desulfovibrio]|uniref:HNH endonuclease n=1 Tax=Desulfovibrio desulfuricans TaxID=876 RepID=A0AA94L3K4_DESDE|nr:MULTISPECIES: HNH endonuclease [Desulfovibrio]ATD82069.1 HNH endonuclease [Desulfovibrio sp. G11]SFW74824.1 HNH endonuclease [Desulfovibrio desulfuricans]SPD34817.1 HNH endonuclease 5 [Desulfovibrio sp. G11]